MITYKQKSTHFTIEYINPETHQIDRTQITLPGHLKKRYRKALTQRLTKQKPGKPPHFNVVQIEHTTQTYQMSVEKFLKNADIQSIKIENNEYHTIK